MLQKAMIPVLRAGGSGAGGSGGDGSGGDGWGYLCVACARARIVRPGEGADQEPASGQARVGTTPPEG